MLPEEIRVQTGPIFQSYTIMAIGNVKLPYGEELTGFSWQGILPGKVRENDPFVLEWRNPHEIQGIWSMYRARGKKLRLLVTETPINHDVYMGPYDVTYQGGHGDYYYSINLVEAKDLFINESSSPSPAQPPAAADSPQEPPPPPLSNTPPPGQERPEPPPPPTHTVNSGDTLWAIAQRKLGAGNRYREIFEANRDVIGNNPGRIFPGQVLTIP
jgi:hypothetical protein